MFCLLHGISDSDFILLIFLFIGIPLILLIIGIILIIKSIFFRSYTEKERLEGIADEDGWGKRERKVNSIMLSIGILLILPSILVIIYLIHDYYQ